MTTALWAALAMLVYDVLAVLLVQAEARNRAGFAAVLDCLMWPAGMACTAIAVTALQGHALSLKAEVFVFVEIANVAGSFIAVAIGRRWIRNDVAVRLAAVEKQLAELTGPVRPA